MNILKWISEAGLEELKTAKKIIGEEIEKRLRSEFNVDDMVRFVGRRNVIVTGKITGVGPKRFTIGECSDHQRWHVPPHLLEKIS